MASFVVTAEAAGYVKEALSEEESPEKLALWIEVAGDDGRSYSYDVFFQEFGFRGSGDLVVEVGEVKVVIPADFASALDGATLDIGDDGELSIANPNVPERAENFPDFGPEALTSDIALKVSGILDSDVNPSIAAHGGYAELVGVVGSKAYVLMGGGCQGCGLAAVTLSQGIATAIQEAVPEIEQVVDVTNHAAGNNPYYQPAKK